MGLSSMLITAGEERIVDKPWPRDLSRVSRAQTPYRASCIVVNAVRKRPVLQPEVLGPDVVNDCLCIDEYLVLAANIDSIASFGDAIPHRLIRPILKGCNADTLLRLEKETPSIQERTSELWKDICVRFYPVAIEEMLKCANEEPESWRDEFFCLRQEEARRFEEAASRCRSQRIEIGELKRKRQVKLTDRLPPPKRSRSGWSSTGPMPPKSLLEKTRKEATKIQKSVFGSRSLPPTTGNSVLSRTKFSASTAQMGQQAGRSVIIDTATVRKPCTLASPSQVSRKPQLPGKSPPDVVRGRTESSSAISRETMSTRNR